MTNAMELLYIKWRENHNDTPETDKFCKIFCEIPLDEKVKIEDAFFSAVFDESEEAFNAGFRTAVQLLMGGSLS